MGSDPKISIITIAYNAKGDLERTVQSVIGQTYQNIEYIIIDGGSTDGTVDVIKKYEKHIAYWVSEPDRGISDAFNKGIVQADEESYILMLNAGDTFLSSESLQSSVGSFREKIVSFQVRTDRGTVQPKSYDFSNVRYDGTLTSLQRYIQAAHLFHQATFVHKSIYMDVGMYDLSFTIRMDLDFFLRALQKYAVQFIAKPIVLYGTDGLSSRLSNRIRFKMEEKKAVCSLLEHKECGRYTVYFYTELPFYLVKKVLSAIKYGMMDWRVK